MSVPERWQHAFAMFKQGELPAASTGIALIEEIAQLQAKVRELEQALRTALAHLQSGYPTMAEESLEAALHVTDKAVKL